MLNTVQILQILFYIIAAAAVLATIHFLLQFHIFYKNEKARLKQKQAAASRRRMDDVLAEFDTGTDGRKILATDKYAQKLYAEEQKHQDALKKELFTKAMEEETNQNLKTEKEAFEQIMSDSFKSARFQAYNKLNEAAKERVNAKKKFVAPVRKVKQNEDEALNREKELKEQQEAREENRKTREEAEKAKAVAEKADADAMKKEQERLVQLEKEILAREETGKLAEQQGIKAQKKVEERRRPATKIKPVFPSKGASR